MEEKDREIYEIAMDIFSIKLLQNNLDIGEMLDELIKSKLLINMSNKSKDETIKMIKEGNNLCSILKLNKLSYDGQIISSNNERASEFAFLESLYLSYHINNTFIKNCRMHLMEYLDILISKSYIFHNCPNDEIDRFKKIINNIVNNYIEKDYLSCIYVAIPQTEYLLRRICINKNIKHYKNRGDGKIGYFMLSRLINEVEKHKIISKDLVSYIRMLLIDTNDIGINLRNDLSHGNPVMINGIYCSTIIFLLIHILSETISC